MALTGATTGTPTLCIGLDVAAHAVGTTQIGARLAASTGATAGVHMNLVDKAGDPPSPTAGDIWRNGAALNYRKDGSTTVDLAAAVLLSKDITIESPTATEDITFFYTNVAITVAEVRVVQVGTTPSVTLVVRHATDRSAVGTLVTTSAAFTNTTTGATAALSDATIPAASYVWIETTATSGTVISTAIHLRYTVD
jgi:hypothetical protein